MSSNNSLTPSPVNAETLKYLMTFSLALSIASSSETSSCKKRSILLATKYINESLRPKSLTVL